MLTTVIETQMQQLASKSLDSSNKFGYRQRFCIVIYCGQRKPLTMIWLKK